MSELQPPTTGLEVAPPADAPAPVASSAGALLKAAREARGYELDQFALLLKVPVRKLEALEADRLDELPGIAFARGLATAMARQVDLDPTVVLALLPGTGGPSAQLESVTRGLATPYREPGERVGLIASPSAWLHPARWVPVVLLAMALAFWFAPPWALLWPQPVAAVADAVKATVAQAVPSAASDASPQAVDGGDNADASRGGSSPGASAVIETVHSAPPDDGSSRVAAGVVVLRTSADSWVEARDAAGSVLLSRMLPAGEVVGLDGSLPIKLKIGNADGTRVSFRGAAVDLLPYTRDNVARVELK